MKTRSIHIVARFGIFALLAIPACAIAEPGDMMHVTDTTQISIGPHVASTAKGVHTAPAAAGTQKTTKSIDMCASRQHDPRALVRISKYLRECTASGYKQIDDVISFRETCSGQMQASGAASFTVQPGNGVYGTIHLEGSMSGQSMSLDTTLEGNVVGTCDYRLPHIAP